MVSPQRDACKQIAVFKEMLASRIELSQQIATPILVIVCQDSGQSKSNVPLDSSQSYTKHLSLFRWPSFLTHIYVMKIVVYLTKIANKIWNSWWGHDPRVDNRSSQSFLNYPSCFSVEKHVTLHKYLVLSPAISSALCLDRRAQTPTQLGVWDG